MVTVDSYETTTTCPVTETHTTGSSTYLSTYTTVSTVTGTSTSTVPVTTPAPSTVNCLGTVEVDVPVTVETVV
jgi:hypothetical protein